MINRLLVLSTLLLIQQTQARLPNPETFTETNPDGTSCTVKLCGDEHFHYECNLEHFTILGPTETGFYVFAQYNNAGDDIEESDCICGSCDPEKYGLEKYIRPSVDVVKEKYFCGGGFCDFDDDKTLEEVEEEEKKGGVLDPILEHAKLEKEQLQQEEEAESSEEEVSRARKRSLDQVQTVMTNLVVLMRFSDHTNRPLPTPSDYDILFNERQCTSAQCPTGSIHDFYDFNSYGELDLNSYVYPQWIDLPNTESYYADGQSGLVRKVSESMIYALDYIDSDSSFSFSDFDLDGNGNIDSITFVHSGFDAAYSSRDCYGSHRDDRIWSHKWYFGSKWYSSDGVKVHKYNVNNGVSGLGEGENCEETPPLTTLGGLAHELAHFFGLPDLYDTNGGGEGMGNWDLMANSWGFDKTDYRPPMFSPWSKQYFGWIDARPIDHDDVYTLSASHSEREVYVISEGYAGDGLNGEYILIENRQRTSSLEFESKLPNSGGLVIYHVDEFVADDNKREGYPGQSSWPENGNHYRIAVLQADGDYDLEKGDNRGDGGDVFHAGGVSSIGPNGAGGSSIYPNLDGYAFGDIVQTGYKIDQISASGYDMSFRFTGLGQEQVVSNMLGTDFHGGNEDAGNMFDITTKVDLSIKAFDIHTSSTSTVQVLIFTRPGSYIGHEEDETGWTNHGTFTASAHGEGNPTRVNGFPPIEIEAGDTMGFYITLTTKEFIYSNSGSVGDIYEENDHLSFIPGTGNAFLFGDFWATRLWNGNIIYDLGITGGSGAATTTAPPVTTAVGSGEDTWVEDALDAGWDAGNGAAGNMFKIEALSDIELRAFDVHCNEAGDKNIKVYTKEDTYEGYEQVRDAWVLLCDLPIPCNDIGTPTPIPRTCFDPFFIAAGSIQSFYITFVTSSMKYTNGEGEGSIIESDGHIIVYEGKGMRYEFGRFFPGRKFNGNIHYAWEPDKVAGASTTVSSTTSATVASTTTSALAETPAPTPSPTPAPTPSPTPAPTPENNTQEFELKTLESALDGTSEARGNMVELRAINQITIDSFDIHLDGTGGGTFSLKVYTRPGTYENHQSSSSGWQLICEDKSLVGQGRNNPTPILASSCGGLPLDIQPGETQSFYFSLTSRDLVYQRSSSWTTHMREFTVAEQNDDLEILVGNAMFDLFRVSSRRYIVGRWNGQVHYRTI